MHHLMLGWFNKQEGQTHIRPLDQKARGLSGSEGLHSCRCKGPSQGSAGEAAPQSRAAFQLSHHGQAAFQLPMHQTKLRCYMCALLYPRHALPKPPGRQGPWPCPASRGAGQGARHLPRLEEHTPSSRPGPRLQGAGAKVTEVSNRF